MPEHSALRAKNKHFDQEFTPVCAVARETHKLPDVDNVRLFGVKVLVPQVAPGAGSVT
jgi:hypothetical protein